MTDIKQITLQQLVDSAVKAQAVIEETEAELEETEAELKVVKDELADRLRQMKIQGTKIGDYLVARKRLVTFPDVPMSKATELGATKISIDANKLRALYNKGVSLKVQITEYVTITFTENK